MNKRSIQETSPESYSENKRPQLVEMAVSNMTVEDLSRLLDAKLETHLQHLATKTDMEKMSQQMADISIKQVDFERKLSAAEERCSQLENQIERLMQKNTERNLILHIPRQENTDPVMQAKDICVNLLQNGTENAVESVRHMNNNNTNGYPKNTGTSQKKINTLVVTFKNSADAYQILKSTNKLKGTQISIHKDYPLTVRNKRIKLIALKKALADQLPGVRAQLRDEKMRITGKDFTWNLATSSLMCGERNGFDVLQEMFTNVQIDILKQAVSSDKYARKTSNGEEVELLPMTATSTFPTQQQQGTVRANRTSTSNNFKN